MTRELTELELCAAEDICIESGHFEGGNQDKTGSCPDCRAAIVALVDAPPTPNLGESSSKLGVGDALPEGSHGVPDTLDWLLRKATMALDEDGENLCIWLNHSADAETEPAFLVICTPSGDDGDLIAEDAPFLTDAQRASLNGSVAHALGYVDDHATIRAAVEYCRRAHEEEG